MPEKKSKGKNRGGRPTKLNQALCDKLDKLITEWSPLRQRSDRAKLNDFLRLSTKENLAYSLGVSRDSLNEYERGSGEFSDTLKRSLETWETHRNAFFMMVLPFFPSPAEWIFLSKNFLSFSDTYRVNEDRNISHKLSIDQIAKPLITSENVGSVLSILWECGVLSSNPPEDNSNEEPKH